MTSLEQDQLLPEEAERDGDLVEKTARSGSGRMWATTASICCYAVLALIANLPLMPWNSADMRQGDLTQVTWSLVWSPWSLLHGHNPFYTDYLNFPVGMNLSQNTTAPLLGWLSSPVTFGINAIASVNILQWLAFFLTASSMYFVGRRLLRSSLSAFLAGLIYGFSPYMVGQGLDHMVINFLPFPPLILLGFYELLIRREGSAIRWGAFLGACEVGQFLISPEIAVTVLLVAVLALSFLGISRPRQIRAALRFGLKGLILAGTIVIVSIAYPVWIMVAGPYHYTGAAHPGGLTADIASTVLPTQMQKFAPPGWMARGNVLVGGNYPENTSYLGIPFIVLIAIISIRYWKQRWLRLALAMLGATLLLSLGPRLEINNHFTGIPLPFTWVQSLPFLENLLAVRLTMYEFFFAAFVVAIGADELLQARRSAENRSTSLLPQRVSYLGLGLIALASVASLLPRWPYPSYPAAVPSYFTSAAVRAIPQGTVVLMSPYPSPAEVTGEQWQAFANMRFKLIGGYGIFTDPNGAADSYSAKLAPTDVETYLWTEVTGGTPYPDSALPAPNAKLHRDLRIFLARYHVGAVLSVTWGANPAAVSKLFTDVLGTPSTSYNGVLAWYDVQHTLGQHAG